MEPACWGIKFKPIIKKVQTDDSKYYLEIIPEVSCLKNFDKIEWKQENVFYEYVIPMAYKVIVRRDRRNMMIRDSIDSLNIMYHSCVDLLHSSATDTAWASGDVNRIVSDTFIVSKLTSDIERFDITIPKNTRIDSICNLKDTIPKSMQTIEEREDFTLTQSKNEETFTATKSTVLVEERQDTSLENSCDTVQHFVEKGTHTGQHAIPPISIDLSDINLLDIHLSEDVTNVVQEVLPEKKPVEYMQKLSLSPICSVIVNTGAVVTTPHLSDNSSLISYDPTIQNSFPCDNRSYTSSFFRYIINTDTMQRYDNLRPKSNEHIEPLRRIAPERRFEYYLNLLRREILPLNNMLDDILTRYAALNIRENDFVKTDISNKQSTSFKMIQSKKVIEEQTKCEKSNRVVYTIVFDG